MIQSPRTKAKGDAFLTALKPMLDQAGNDLAGRCINHLLGVAEGQLQLLGDAEFINAVKRSIESVVNAGVAEGAQVLAFKLAFNLDSQSLTGSDQQSESKDKDWEDTVTEMLGPQAAISMIACRGMSQVMLVNSKDVAVLADSLDMSVEMFNALLPKKLKPEQLSAYANMAMALRNVVVQAFDQQGGMSASLKQTLLDGAQDLLAAQFKGKGQSNAVAWTLELLKLADDRPATAQTD